jgi:hypothetical protein
VLRGVIYLVPRNSASAVLRGVIYLVPRNLLPVIGEVRVVDARTAGLGPVVPGDLYGPVLHTWTMTTCSSTPTP